ncbi:MAG: hypothetical protein ORN49_10210 [Rhodobacteraceae bacterium]|nr:hypothetical protein [Paracoccaceae bacterium]
MNHPQPDSAPQGGRQKNFYRIERAPTEEALHRAVRHLHQRTEPRDPLARVRHYLRIEKGWTV